VQWATTASRYSVWHNMVEDINSKTFGKVEDREAFVDDFCNIHYHPVRRYSRTTVDQCNRKIKAEECRIVDVPGNQAYGVWWVCKHFGQDVNSNSGSAGDGLTRRRNRLQLKKGSSFLIYMAWNWQKIYSSNLQHSHDTGPEFSKTRSARQWSSGSVGCMTDGTGET